MWRLVLTVILLANGCFSKTERPPLNLEPVAYIDKDYQEETSGITQSRQHPGVFWVHDDSGNDDLIYAINIQGEAASGDKNYKGQKIIGTDNDDWEDIFTDDQGHIIIADIGNNCECRNDLAFYFLKETDPGEEENEVVRHIRFMYPDVESLPELINGASFDAEAAFYFDGNIYIFTKHPLLLSKTRLYKLQNFSKNEVHQLTFVQEFSVDGPVTAADATHDGKYVAVLTYNSVWLLEAGEDGDFLSGKTYTRKINAEQAEGITFDNDNNLIITDEKEGKIYRVPLSELEEVE